MESKEQTKDYKKISIRSQEKSYFVTDLHGHPEPLEQFSALMAEDKNIALYVGGDIIDRGPDSEQSVECLMLLSKNYQDRVHSVLGNHEIMFLCWAARNCKKLGISEKEAGAIEKRFRGKFEEYARSFSSENIRGWALTLARTSSGRKKLKKYFDFFKTWPVVLRVENEESSFNLVHAALPCSISELKVSRMNSGQIDAAVWTRVLAEEQPEEEKKGEELEQKKDMLSSKSMSSNCGESGSSDPSDSVIYDHPGEGDTYTGHNWPLFGMRPQKKGGRVFCVDTCVQERGIVMFKGINGAVDVVYQRDRNTKKWQTIDIDELYKKLLNPNERHTREEADIFTTLYIMSSADEAKRRQIARLKFLRDLQEAFMYIDKDYKNIEKRIGFLRSEGLENDEAWKQALKSIAKKIKTNISLFCKLIQSIEFPIKSDLFSGLNRIMNVLSGLIARKCIHMDHKLMDKMHQFCVNLNTCLESQYPDEKKEAEGKIKTLKEDIRGEIQKLASVDFEESLRTQFETLYPISSPKQTITPLLCQSKKSGRTDDKEHKEPIGAVSAHALKQCIEKIKKYGKHLDSKKTPKKPSDRLIHSAKKIFVSQLLGSHNMRELSESLQTHEISMLAEPVGGNRCYRFFTGGKKSQGDTLLHSLKRMTAEARG